MFTFMSRCGEKSSPPTMSSICESEFKACRLPYTVRPQHLLGFLSLHSVLDASSIWRTHPGTFMHPLYLRSSEFGLNFDGWWWRRTRTQGRKITKERILRNSHQLTSPEKECHSRAKANVQILIKDYYLNIFFQWINLHGLNRSPQD